jgi:hypothetical protein
VSESPYYIGEVVTGPDGVKHVRRQISLSPKFPKIVCLCGSTKFYKEYVEANERETLAGNVVLSVGLSGRHKLSEVRVHEDVCMGMQEVTHLAVVRADWRLTDEQKAMLDELHKRKIDLADEVLVLNVGGYVGESTRTEIEYAGRHGKPVRYLEAV